MPAQYEIDREAEDARNAAADKARQLAEGLWGDMRKIGGAVKGEPSQSRPDRRARGGQEYVEIRRGIPTKYPQIKVSGEKKD